MKKFQIRALDVGGHTKSLVFEGNNCGELWFANGFPDKIPSVETPHDVESSEFVERLENALFGAGLIDPKHDTLRGMSICGPVTGNVCLRPINRGVKGPFHIPDDYAVLNDGMAATIASRIAGVAKDHEGALLLLTLGTGVGMGSFIWSNGQLAMNDGEAHVTVRNSVRRCQCGRFGCLEAAANELFLKDALISRAIPENEIGDDVGRALESFLKLNDSKGMNYQGKAQNTLDLWHRNLADGLASMYALLNLGGNDMLPPAMFVMAGGLSALIDENALAGYIRNEFANDPFMGSNFLVRRENMLGNRAGCIGVAALALAKRLECNVLDIKFLDKAPKK